MHIVVWGNFPFKVLNVTGLIAQYKDYEVPRLLKFHLIQGGPIKRNGTLPIIFGCINWYQWMRHLLLRKMYQDQQFGFSSLFSRAHLWDNDEVQPFPLLAKSRLEWMSSGLTIVSSNPFNLSMLIFTRVDCWCKECTLIKLNGLLLTLWQAESSEPKLQILV